MSQKMKEKLFRGGLWALGGKIISILCAFVLNVVLTHALTPTEYGSFFVAFNTVIILATVATLGIDQVVVRLLAVLITANDINGVRNTVLQCLKVVLLGTVVTCFCYYVLSDWVFVKVFNAPVIADVVSLMTAWIMFASLQRQIAETFRGFKNIRFATLVGGLRNNGVIISLVACVSSIVLFICDALTLQTTCALMCFSSIVAISFGLMKLKELSVNFIVHEDMSGDKNNKKIRIKSLLSDAWPLWCAAMLSALRMQGDGLLVSAFDNQENVALYGAAQRFVALLVAPLTIVNAVLPPFLAELYAVGKIHKLERLIRTVAGLITIPAIVCTFVLVIFGSEALQLIFGPYYAAAYAYLIILMIGQVINILTGSCYLVLVMSGHKREVFLLTIFSTVLLVITGLVGGYLWGAIGVAIASSVATAIHNLLGMSVARMRVGVLSWLSFDRRFLSDILSIFATSKRSGSTETIK